MVCIVLSGLISTFAIFFMKNYLFLAKFSASSFHIFRHKSQNFDIFVKVNALKIDIDNYLIFGVFPSLFPSGVQ